MLGQLKVFIFGLLVGAIVAFPLGINFGRDEPLLSNPFAKQPVKKQVVEKAEEALETAREQVHKATEPAKKKLEEQVK
jgi:hypothetical protein